MLSQPVYSDQDRSKAEKISLVVARIVESFTNMVNPVDSFERVGILFDKLSNAGIQESLVEILRNYAQFVQATFKSKEPTDSQMQISSGSARTVSEITIANYLKVLRFSCQYSQQVFI